MAGQRSAEALRTSPAGGTGTWPARRGLAPEQWTFVLWAESFYLAVVAVGLWLSLRRTGGRLVYLIDDPAIHLSVASNLVHHGTWGVVPGHFQSASSSPLWTLVLAGATAVLPFASTAMPLILNVLAGSVLIGVLGTNQRALRPRVVRPLDVAAVGVLVVVVLFLPSLTLLGMEHVVHMALVLAALAMFHRQSADEQPRWPWAPYVLLSLAVLTRFETAFLVVGLFTAVLASSTSAVSTPGGPITARSAMRRAALVAAAGGLPLGAFAVVNRAMGQGWLPNSVLVKGHGLSGAGGGVTPKEILDRLTADPMLSVLSAACLGAVVLGWSTPRRWTLPALAVVVTVAST